MSELDFNHELHELHELISKPQTQVLALCPNLPAQKAKRVAWVFRYLVFEPAS